MKLAEFEKGWPVVFGAFRDIMALAAGLKLLLFMPAVDMTLHIIGFLLLTLSATGAARAFLRDFGSSGTSRGR